VQAYSALAYVLASPFFMLPYLLLCYLIFVVIAFLMAGTPEQVG
jgi:hypothetical protein